MNLHFYAWRSLKKKNKTYWKPYGLHCCSFRKKNECFEGQSFKYWPLNYEWSSSIGKRFMSWVVRDRLLVWGDSWSFEGCSWNASTLLSPALGWPPAAVLQHCGGWTQNAHWQETGSSVWPHTPSLSGPHAYYSNPRRCWEGELIFVWKRSPPPEQINTWAVCLCCLLSFCTARLFCRERSIDDSNLQQPGASHVRQST